MSHCSSSYQAIVSSQSGHRQHSSPAHDQSWYLDSGATNHITPDVANLLTVSPYTGTRQVSMGNGDSVLIVNIGTSNMQAGFRLLRLQNVLHVPTV